MAHDSAKGTGILRETVGGLRTGQPKVWEGLTLVPLFDGSQPPLDILTLDEALEAKEIVITETSEAGNVPELFVTNNSGKPVLIIDSEELVGAKQNRILNTNILVAAGAKITVPVSCVEAGRWHSLSEQFTTKGNMAFPSLRRCKSEKVTMAFREMEAPLSDQGEVWDQIEVEMRAACAYSPTYAMNDLFEVCKPDTISAVEAFKPEAKQIGHVIIQNGVICGADIFHDECLYGHYHSKLISSYTVQRNSTPLSAKPQSSEQKEGAGDAAAAAQDAAKRFLADASECLVESYPGISLGMDHRIQSEAVTGSVFEYEGKNVFAQLFTKQPADKPKPFFE